MTHKKLQFIMASFDLAFVYAAVFAFFAVVKHAGWVDLSWAKLGLHSLVITLFFPVLALYFGLYRDRWYFYAMDDLGFIFKTVTLGCLFAFAYFALAGFKFRPLFVLYLYVLLFATYFVSRFVLGTFIRWLSRRGVGLRRLAVVGTGESARVFAEKVLKGAHLGYDLVGFISDGDDTTDVDESKVLGPIRNIRSIVLEKDIAELVITHSSNPEDRVRAVTNNCVGLDVAIRAIPDVVDMVSGRVRIIHLDGVPLADVVGQPLFGWYYFVKRALDIVYALVGLTVSAAVFSVLWPFVRSQSGGSFFYKQERIGRDSESYVMYKIRSMVANAESESGPIWAGTDDPRVTPVGRFIRRYRIDELPQLINVLKGDMSIVGPRPERRKFVEEFGRTIPLYTRRLAVKPGITGLAQVKHKYDETLDDVREKLKYDLYYIDHMTLGLDLRIYIWTLQVILTGKGVK
ncbi:MAG: sugar transferase [Candidatus Coatesbacteria bacterium]|nr:MAG: sugar transferase [Candidatus Coatesbacteria bacterium]